MMISGAALAEGSVLKTRVCIIGTGMGGGTVAHKLIERGERDILLVEAGDLRDEMTGASEVIRTDHVGLPFRLPITRSISVGGSSNFWHGICAPLDEIDFEPRPWMPGSGWPIRKSDLESFYNESAELHGIGTTEHFDAERLPPELQPRRKDIRVNDSIVKPKVVKFRNPPLRWREEIQKWVAAGLVRCLTGAPALELQCDASGKVTRLIAGTAKGKVTIEAEVFVVCAGALETPRLLLNSRDTMPDGIGNATGLVGRYLLDHPIGHYSKIKFNKPTDAPLYATAHLSKDLGVMTGLRLSEQLQAEQQLANHYLWIRPSVTPRRINDELLLSFLGARKALDLTFKQIVGILTNRDILYRVIVHHFGLHPKYRYGDLFFMTEQLPNPNSSVSISERQTDAHGYPVARIDWQLMHSDFDGFHRHADLLFDHGMTGDNYAICRRDNPQVWDSNVASGAHHLGTARMGDDAARGVVDKNLQVFGTRNLYVCDGSVFTTAGSVNPSLTISALGLRLGDRIVQQLRAPEVNQVQTAPANA